MSKPNNHTVLAWGICPVCGQDFLMGRSSRLWRKYCGPECARQAKNHGEKPKMDKPRTTPRTCLKCGNLFPSEHKGNRICWECAHRNYSIERDNRVEEEGFWIA